MKVSSVQPNNTTFGTRYGKNFSKFIEESKDKLTSEQIKNISMIRNNGINSVLELEEASAGDKLHGIKYNLNLTGGVFDRNNYYMNWGTPMHKTFQEKIKTVSGAKQTTPFPIPIKDLNENTTSEIAKQFNEGNGLEDKIRKEYDRATRIENEFKKFEQEWYSKK